MKSKMVPVMAAFFCAAAVFSSCGNDNNGIGGTFYTVITDNPKNLDPQTSDDPCSMSIMDNIFEGLVCIGENGSPRCAAAESFNVSDDGMRYVFRLRDGIKWNGAGGFRAELTADDFVYAFRRIFDPDMMSPYAQEFSCIKNSYEVYSGIMAQTDLGVYAEDERTVVFELEYPENEFLYMLCESAAFPCNEEFFLSTEGRYGLSEEFCAGNGAFTLIEWNYDPYWTENFLLLRKTAANSFEDHVTYPNYVNFMIADSVKDYERSSGITVDCEFCTAAELPVLRKKKLREYECTSVGITFNPDNARLADDNMRFALAAASDPYIFEGKTSLGVTPARTLIPPAICLMGKSVREVIGEPGTPFFPEEKASEWYARGNENYHDGENLLSIMVSDAFADAPLMYMLTDSWSDMTGVECGVESISEKKYRERLSSGDYDIALTSVTCRRNSPSGFINEFDPYIFSREQMLRAQSYAASARSSRDIGTAAEYYGYAENTLLSGAYYIPLFRQSSFLVTSESTEGIICEPFSGRINFKYAKKYN